MKPPYRNALGFHYPNKACVRLQCRNGLGGPALNRPSCCSTARLQHGRRVPAELQSGALTMRVQPRIMQLRRFMTLLVQRRVRCPKGESQTTRGRPRIMQLRHARPWPVPLALNRYSFPIRSGEPWMQTAHIAPPLP